MRAAATVALAAGLSAACGGDSMPSRPPTPRPPERGNTCFSRAPLLEARQEVGTAELAGRIYVVGGFRADGSSANTVEVYDPASDRWSMVAPMPLGLNHPAAAAMGGWIYVAGGSPAAAGRALERYDPAADRWTPLPPMPTPRQELLLTDKARAHPGRGPGPYYSGARAHSLGPAV